ncbi:MAG: hypothetical protein JWP74_3534 [Marmoricola sp.]|nr:hypothetical protein [Marmoricola sp.]
MDAHLAELSRTIDASELGRRIRNARIAAGLTQAELAADDVTPAYVSRIEDGQRRPEFGLLNRMAGRMSSTLEALLQDPTTERGLELQLALDYAELSLRSGEPADALAGADAACAELTKNPYGDLLRRARLLRASALEATGDLSGAIIELEDLVAAPTPSVDWVRALIALSRCYRDTGELASAISVGERATATIEDLELAGLTESIQLTVTVAGAYMMRGDLEQAMRLCLRAITAAEAADSPLAKASAYWNASSIESRRGERVRALELARKALTYFEIGDDARNLARLRGHVADMQLDSDPPDALGAIETLTQAARELDSSPGSTVDRASQLQTRAKAFLILGQIDEAAADVRASLELAPESAAFLRACGHSLEGQLAMDAGNTSEARAAFLTAVHLLSGIGADREAAQLWFELAGLLRDVGESEAAMDAFQRAAASTGLQTSSLRHRVVRARS